jgi:hypothetical protein
MRLSGVMPDVWDVMGDLYHELQVLRKATKEAADSESSGELPMGRTIDPTDIDARWTALCARS